MKRNRKNWKPEKIRAALVLRKIRQTEIARRCGKSRQLVNRVISGNVVSGIVHRELARAIGVDVREIWPERYSEPVKVVILGA